MILFNVDIFTEMTGDLASTFMALQIARTRERIAHNAFTSELLEFTDERPLTQDAVRRFITERHGHTPEDPEVEAAWSLATFETQDFVPSFEKVFSVSMENATIRMAPLLSGLHWRVETVDAPILWTCDRPLMPWRPPSSRTDIGAWGTETPTRSGCRSVRWRCWFSVDRCR